MTKREILDIYAMNGLNPYLSGGIDTLEERCKEGNKEGKSITLESTKDCKKANDWVAEGGNIHLH